MTYKRPSGRFFKLLSFSVSYNTLFYKTVSFNLFHTLCLTLKAVNSRYFYYGIDIAYVPLKMNESS